MGHKLIVDNAIQQLIRKRKSEAIKPFNARGKKTVRCQWCQVGIKNCICCYRFQLNSQLSFLFLYHRDEVLKPSNTGKLVADLVEDTHAFIWSRTDPESELIKLLQANDRQPVVVFPATQAMAGQAISHVVPSVEQGKKLLLIFLDGTWREARRIYRKSPYLHHYPLLSLQVDSQFRSKYGVRKANDNRHMATAEAAAQVMLAAGEHDNAALLQSWFELFSFNYQKSVTQANVGNAYALSQLQALVNTIQS